MSHGSRIFAFSLLLIVILFFIPTMTYTFKARVFPLIALFAAASLLIIQIVQEFLPKPKAEETDEQRERKGFGRKHLSIWAWMVCTPLMLWVLGFMGTVVLLPFLYLRFQREGWLVTILVSAGCGVTFYFFFGFALKMPLYPGLIYLKIFS